ncbi:hypothetical protein AB0K47_03170 [Streptomyces tirandamycinicus]|uniref:Gluconolaconase n=1 Tax=Streptomyces tirandamycinicus TaxID=2174846 RepID=A0A2S1SPA5_9ACTN|nr:MULTISPECIES: hypothetical protein [Streptomyces]AWI28187.1 hypothetical protein DDW44_04800 [Streptomyces tirandamycinicus]MCY0980245.1 hypothetical protein [Streptomyces tirandamycinicus]NNJ05965.1 hypothetical protein [Streptomyces sp. PKU-MA01144]TFE37212.1 hypothetical protein E3E14_29910 [Streptomyces sp. ICN441]
MPSTAYILERAKRRPLTKKNLRELDIEHTWKSILNHPNLVYVDDYGAQHKPVGFSVNKSSFGSFPGSASQLGWIAYMNLGEPLIEERGDIGRPSPDTFSSRSYVNRGQSPMNFTDSVDFTVSNGVTWSLHGEAKLTFGGSVSAQLQLQLQNQLRMDLQSQLQTQLRNDMTNKNTTTVTNKNSKDNIGVDNATATDTATTNSAGNSAANTVTNSVGFTTQGSATGTGTLNASLLLGISASVGGSLTTSWASKSQISGEVPANSRVQTVVTQRRTRKQFVYEIPVTFSGLIAVKYDVPVAVLSPPQPGNYPGLDQLVARDIGDIDLAGGDFRMKGLAEVVSALEVDHTMFDVESLTDDPRALSKQP